MLSSQVQLEITEILLQAEQQEQNDHCSIQEEVLFSQIGNFARLMLLLLEYPEVNGWRVIELYKKETKAINVMLERRNQ